METIYSWEPLFQAAVLETDDGKLPKLIEEARTAINLRFRELGLDGNNPAEQHALQKALDGLKILQEERCQAADLNKP